MKIRNKKSLKKGMEILDKVRMEQLKYYTCGILERHDTFADFNIPKKQKKKMNKAMQLIFEVNQSCFDKKKKI